MLFVWIWIGVCLIEAVSTDICGFPGSPANGSVAIKKDVRATYACDAGHVLFGDLKRKCLPNGTWSGEVPTCDFNIAKGQRASQSDTFFNYTAEQAVDGHLDTCAFTPKVNHRWWQVELDATYTVAAVAVTIGVGSFQKFTVFVLSALPDGKFASEQCNSYDGIFDSDTIVLVCNSGRGRTGNLLFIRDDRIAVEYFGLCEVEVFRRRDNHPCGEPETPLNMKVTRITPRQVEFDCLTGHKLEGVARHTCIDGRWKGPLPVCQEIACNVPAQIANGLIKVFATEERFVIGTVANYSCDEGFFLSGNGSRVCEETGKWSGSEPLCKAIDCGRPPTIPHGWIETNSSLWRASGTIICDEGYWLATSAEVVCTIEGHWRVVNATCRTDILAPLETDYKDKTSNLTSVVVGSVIAVVVTLVGIIMIAYLRKRWIFNLIKGNSNNTASKNNFHHDVSHSHSNLVDDPIYDDISYANNCFNTENAMQSKSSVAGKSPNHLTVSNENCSAMQNRIYDQPTEELDEDEAVYYTPVEFPSTKNSTLPKITDGSNEGGTNSSENPVYEVLDAKGLDSAIYAQVDLEKKKKDREESFRRRQKSASSVDLTPDSGVYENVEFSGAGGSSSGTRDSQGSVHRPLPPIPSETSLIVDFESMDNELYNEVCPDQEPQDDAKWEKSDSIYAALDLRK